MRLIMPGMTIMKSGSTLMKPAIRVAPWAWDSDLAANNRCTITLGMYDNSL